MISVVIPTYNYKCYTLARDLQQQLAKTGVEHEVIVAEDGGKDQVVAISNHRINELPNCHYIRRTENVGRAAIRNFLAKEAKGEWLLFCDSDALVISPDFIQQYLDAMKEGADVICGGWTHTQKCPSKEQSLRWKYETDYERRKDINKAPFRSFAFLIRRSVFDTVGFDTRYERYGMEDTQFGINLKKHGFSILNINNPMLNDDIETNGLFLKKTEEALQTMKKFEGDLKEVVRLIRIAQRIKAWHLAWAVRMVFYITKLLVRRNLLGKDPNLYLFAFYKLGYFLSLK